MKSSLAFLFFVSNLLLALSIPDCELFAEPVSKTVSNQGKFSVWHSDLEALIWVDSPAFTPAWKGSIIRAFTPADQQTYTVKVFQDEIVGSVMPRKSGGIVFAMSTPNGQGYTNTICAVDIDGSFQASNMVTLATLPNTPGRFNNGNCDPLGRYLVGTYPTDSDPYSSGAVWTIQRHSGSYNVSKTISNINHPNGLVWSTQGDQLLFSETSMNVVFKYPYSLVDGSVGSPQKLITSPSGGGLIDSMCGLADGSVFITDPSSARLVKYSAEGRPICDYQVRAGESATFVASCAFAGDQIYIPSGRNGGDDQGPAGWLFRTAANVTGGLPATPCDL